jgi:hypothetical protein
MSNGASSVSGGSGNVNMPPMVVTAGGARLSRHDGNMYGQIQVRGNDVERAKASLTRWCEQKGYAMVGEPSVNAEGFLEVQLGGDKITLLDSTLDALEAALPAPPPPSPYNTTQ